MSSFVTLGAKMLLNSLFEEFSSHIILSQVLVCERGLTVHDIDLQISFIQ
jgi:hypothetical protein